MNEIGRMNHASLRYGENGAAGRYGENGGTHGSCVQSNASEHHPQRKSPRTDFHDYSGGDYFVTVCTRDKAHYFGKIADGKMRFSEIGRYCDKQIGDLPKHYPYASVPIFVVMPNHIHAIISIKSTSPRTHEPCDSHSDSVNNRTHEPCVPTMRTALSVVIGGLKRAVTMFARRNGIEFGWQSRYHDHIIRGTHDGNRIAEYIDNNVARRANDCFYK